MIYLVEDDESIRELVVYTLNSQGLEAQGLKGRHFSGKRWKKNCLHWCFWTLCFRRKTDCLF